MKVVSLTQRRMLRSIDEILLSTGLDYLDVSDICEKKVKCGNDLLSLNLTNIDKLLRHLNIDLNSFAKGNYCIESIIQHLNGNIGHIPTYLINNPKSKMKSITNVLSFLDEDKVKLFCRMHQISPEILRKDDERISIELFLRAVIFSTKYNGKDVSPYTIGRSNSVRFNNVYEENFTPPKSLFDAYEDLINGAHLVEENMRYTILKKTSDKFVVRGELREHTCEIVSRYENANETLFQNVAGFLSGYSTTQNSNVKVRTISSSASTSIFEVRSN